jgi:hypothetical protein
VAVPVAVVGFTAQELGARAIAGRVRGSGFDEDLLSWLLREGLAELQDGRLIPTARCVELAASLDLFVHQLDQLGWIPPDPVATMAG